MFLNILRKLLDLPVSIKSGEYKKIARLRSTHLFDPHWYRLANPDLQIGQLTVYQHYVRYGGQELRDPSRYFDAKVYARRFPNWDDSSDSPLFHYLDHGLKLGAKVSQTASPSRADLILEAEAFDEVWYRTTYPHTRAYNGSQFEHFILHGEGEGLKPGPNGLPKHLRLIAPDEQEALDLHTKEQQLWETEIGKSGLFDPAWYMVNAPGVENELQYPLTHFMELGASQGLSPGPNFDVGKYNARHPGQVATSQNALLHYLSNGAKLGEPAPSCDDTDWELVEASDLFDPIWYQRQYPEATKCIHGPLFHYLFYGRLNDYCPGPNFDPLWYRKQHNYSGQDPFLYHLRHGAKVGITLTCDNGTPKNLDDVVSHFAWLEPSIAQIEGVADFDQHAVTVRRPIIGQKLTRAMETISNLILQKGPFTHLMFTGTHLTRLENQKLNDLLLGLVDCDPDTNTLLVGSPGRRDLPQISLSSGWNGVSWVPEHDAAPQSDQDWIEFCLFTARYVCAPYLVAVQSHAALEMFNCYSSLLKHQSHLSAVFFPSAQSGPDFSCDHHAIYEPLLSTTLGASLLVGGETNQNKASTATMGKKSSGLKTCDHHSFLQIIAGKSLA